MLTETNKNHALAPVDLAQKLTLSIYCTVDEFADTLKVSRGTVFTWLRAGLPSLSVGRTRRIIVERAYCWLEAGGADQTRRSTRAKRTTS